MGILDELSSKEEASFLDDLVPKGAMVPRIDITKILSEYFKEEETERTLVPSLHPSELATIDCMHYHMYSYENIKVKQNNSQRLNLIFENGHSVHEKWQKILSPYLKGSWKCKSCGHMHGENVKYREYLLHHELEYSTVTGNTKVDFSDVPQYSPQECSKCGGKDFIYKEWKVVSLENLICGRTDGVLVWDGAEYILEIKSANVASFESLSSNGLLGKYKKQTGIYMYYTGIKYCMILVENKNTQETKLFFYDLDVIMQEPYFQNAIRKINAISGTIINEYPTPSPVKSPECEKCKYKGVVCNPK